MEVVQLQLVFDKLQFYFEGYSVIYNMKSKIYVRERSNREEFDYGKSVGE